MKLLCSRGYFGWDVVLRLTTVLSSLIVFSCGSPKESKSPNFMPGTQVKFRGKILKADKKPLSNSPLVFQNSRYFGYIDTTSSSINLIKNILLLPLRILNLGSSEGLPADLKTKYSADLFTTDLQTDAQGQFSLSVDESKLLRDSQGAINVTIAYRTAAGMSSLKYDFVVKGEETVFDDFYLCDDLAPAINQDGNDINVIWKSGSNTTLRTMLNIRTPSNKGLIWVQSFEGNVLGTKFKKALLSNKTASFNLERFYVDEELKKVACLSPSVDYNALDPDISLSKGSITSTPKTKFKFVTLGNGNFNDNLFLEPFDVKTLVQDFGKEITFARIYLHNFKADNQASLSFSVAGDNSTVYSDIAPANVIDGSRRFLEVILSQPVTARYLKVESSSKIVDLQEMTVSKS